MKGEEAVRRLVDGEPDALDAVSAAYTPLLNYVIFAYTENYFISKQIQSEVETNSNLQALSQENNGFPSMGILGADNMFGIGYKPITENDIPNFLSSKWAI